MFSQTWVRNDALIEDRSECSLRVPQVGSQVLRRLTADGQEVVGFTKTSAHAGMITEAGAVRAIVGDALDASSVRAALETTRPEAVIHALTAIPSAAHGTCRT